MDINGLFGGSKPNAKTRAQGAPVAGGASPTMGGDKLQLSTQKTAADEAAAMTPEQAQKEISQGGTMIGFGILGVAACYWGASAAATAMGTIALPAIVGLGAIALGLWGAKKLGTGLSAKFQQATSQALKLPE
jgi:hypothetical protein